MYTWLFQKYRLDVGDWASEKELTRQLKVAYLKEASKLLKVTLQEDAPFDPWPCLCYQGVHDLRWIEGLPEEARLIPDDKGFSLWVRKPKINLTVGKSQFPPRLRTTLAHELGHTFFYDLSNRPPKSLSSYMSMSRLHQSDINEEWWCMDFARAFLIPQFWIAHNLAQTEFPSLKVASELRKQLLVSWDILFRRLIWDLKVWTACTIFRVDMDGLHVTGLWKSEEFRSWSFKKWFESEGMRLVAQGVKEELSRNDEATCRTATSEGHHFRLELFRTSPDNVLGAIGEAKDL